MKNTVELLELAGYTEAQIDRYTKCLKRKKAGTLTIADRRFYLQAQGDARKAEAALEQAVKAAQTRKVNGRQPVETKLHYRWVVAELEIARGMVELAPGEVSGLVIRLEEYLRAMDKYQPVLDQIDTSKRHMFNPVERDLLQIAAGLGRMGTFDHAEFQARLKATFSDNWNTAWDGLYNSGAYDNAILPEGEELEFRAVVRAEMERLVRDVFPSVEVVAA
jgi:tetratricopeptide (TPR) repeat protein